MVPVTGSDSGAAPGPSLISHAVYMGLSGGSGNTEEEMGELLLRCCPAEPKRSEPCSLPPAAP